MALSIDGAAYGEQLISCIMPTRNRRNFVGQAISYFLRQDYPFKELVILDDGEDTIGDLVPHDERVRYFRLNPTLSLGAKRNLGCELSRGEFIALWDDDDWSSPQRLRVQLSELRAADALACGVSDLLHYCPATGQAWLYRPLPQQRSWVAGCTLLYRKAFWQSHPFPEVNVGEDSAFVSQCPPVRMLPISDPALYVSIIHPGNTSARNVKDPRWQRRPLEEVSRLLWHDRDFYAWLRNGCPPRQASRNPGRISPSKGCEHDLPQHAVSARVPKVSCVMPTHNRREFVSQAIKYFLRQDYANKELIVVDDGDDAVADLVPSTPLFQYIRLSARHSIGVKRNLAGEAARGEILLTWDDDDWYSPDRISYQVQPLLTGRAEVTGLGNTLMLSLPEGEFWACSPTLYDHMFFQGIHGGTLTFWRDSWQQGARFASSSLAEEVPVQQALMRQGARLEKLANQGKFIYIRHGSNAWQFVTGKFLDRSGWSRAEVPPFVPEEDLKYYGLARTEGIAGNGRGSRVVSTVI